MNIVTMLIATLFTYHFINQMSSGFTRMIRMRREKTSRREAVEKFAEQFGMTIIEADKLVFTEK